MEKRNFLRHGTVIIILVVMMITMLSAQVYATETDVDISGHWGENVINKCISYDVMKGYGGYFRPDDFVTRAEFAAMVNRAFGYTNIEVLTLPTDTGSDDWYAGDINTAVSLGYIQGYGNDRLGAADKLTREQAFTVLARILRLAADSSEKSKFTDDGSISEWAKGAVVSMSGKGYVNGFDGKVNPQDNITRAETAQLLVNIFGEIIDENFDAKSAVYKNVTIRKAGVELSNFTVLGDMYITEGVGDGDITLNSIKIDGRLLVAGGGENSINVRNLEVGENVIADKPPIIGQQPLRFKAIQSKDKTVIFEGIVRNIIITEDIEIFIDADGGRTVFNIFKNGMDSKPDMETRPNIVVNEGALVKRIDVKKPADIVSEGNIDRITVDGGVQITVDGREYIGDGLTQIAPEKEDSSSTDEKPATGRGGTVRYTVIFNSDGGVIENQRVERNSKATAPTEPRKEGYIFDGWHKDEQLTEAWNFETDRVTGNITLYAKWIVSTYDISLDAAGIHTFADATYGYGAQTALTVTITKDGNSDITNLAVAIDDAAYFTLTGPQSTTLDETVQPTELTITPKPALNAGIYTADITVTGDNGASGGFSVSFTVKKATLTIAADDKGIIYGDAPPVFTAQYSGFVNDEGESVLGGTLAFDSLYSQGDDTDTYTITPKGLTSDNYDIDFEDGILTVAKAAAPSITFPTSTDITYGAALSTSVLNGGSVEYGSFAWKNGSTIPTVTNTGYEVVFIPNAAAEKNYQITETDATVGITVNKATPAYSVPTGLVAVYGNTLANVTLTGGFSWENEVTASVGGAGTNSGFTVKYTPSDTANYHEVAGVPINITVSPKPITLIVSGTVELSPISATSAITTTVTGLLGGDTANATLASNSLGVTLSENILTYDGTATAAAISNTLLFGLDNENYTASSTLSADIYDGKAAARSIRVKQSNILAFNTYANTADGRNKFYILTENIDLIGLDTDGDSANGNWTPIGTTLDSTSFSGTFDGNGKTISNMTINLQQTCTAMFRSISSAGTVKGLTLANTEITVSGFSSSCTGALVGMIFGTVTYLRKLCALNPSVVSTQGADCGRIYGRKTSGNYGTGEAYYASDLLSLTRADQAAISSDAQGRDGQTITPSEYNSQSFYQNSLELNFATVWIWDSTSQRPKLR